MIALTIILSIFAYAIVGFVMGFVILLMYNGHEFNYANQKDFFASMDGFLSNRLNESYVIFIAVVSLFWPITFPCVLAQMFAVRIMVVIFNIVRKYK